MGLFGLIRQKRQGNSNGQKFSKKGRPSREMQVEKKLAALKAARTDLLLLQTEVRRRELERQLAGDGELTAGQIEKVTRYLSQLGFTITPKESLSGDDWRGILKDVAKSIGPALLSGLATSQQPAAPAAPLPPIQVVVPTSHPTSNGNGAGKELRLEPPSGEVPAEVQPLVTALVGKTPREAAEWVLANVPPMLRSQLVAAAGAGDGDIDQALQRLSDLNPSFSSLTGWLRSQKPWLEATGRELKGMMQHAQ